jgi:hypothetical protein
VPDQRPLAPLDWLRQLLLLPFLSPRDPCRSRRPPTASPESTLQPSPWPLCAGRPSGRARGGGGDLTAKTGRSRTTIGRECLQPVAPAADAGRHISRRHVAPRADCAHAMMTAQRIFDQLAPPNAFLTVERVGGGHCTHRIGVPSDVNAPLSAMAHSSAPASPLGCGTAAPARHDIPWVSEYTV